MRAWPLTLVVLLAGCTTGVSSCGTYGWHAAWDEPGLHAAAARAGYPVFEAAPGLAWDDATLRGAWGANASLDSATWTSAGLSVRLGPDGIQADVRDVANVTAQDVRAAVRVAVLDALAVDEGQAAAWADAVAGNPVQSGCPTVSRGTAPPCPPGPALAYVASLELRSQPPAWHDLVRWQHVPGTAHAMGRVPDPVATTMGSAHLRRGAWELAFTLPVWTVGRPGEPWRLRVDGDDHAYLALESTSAQTQESTRSEAQALERSLGVPPLLLSYASGAGEFARWCIG